MFGESKITEPEAPAPLSKPENNLNRKTAPGENLNSPAATGKTNEMKFAANYSRLKKSLRKGSRGIF